jgi:5'-methylthioadenosine phosphorylase
MVVVDQFIDRTRLRPQTFFGDGLVGHVQMADPVCADLAGVLYDSAKAAGATVHRGGTYLCIEGPQFSTRAESKLYRSWGVDVIGMTNLPEARLAREAELCYATVALSTDYDCWHQSEDDVSVEAVIAVMKSNVRTAQEIIRQAAGRLAGERTCGCGHALANALMTSPALVPASTRRRLDLLVGRYLPPLVKAGAKARKKRLSPPRRRRTR